MTRFVGATEAARLLGVQRATLYAYVSRGLIARRVAVDGRTSLYSADDLDALAGRVRRRESRAAPVARRADRHRRHDARRGTASATAATTSPSWPARHVRAGGRAAVDRRAAGRGDVARAAARRRPPGSAGRRRRSAGRRGVPALAAVASALGVHHAGDDPPAAARRLLGVVPAVLGDRRPPATSGGLGRAPRRGVATGRRRRRSGRRIDRALVLLADHELATQHAGGARRRVDVGRARTRRSPPGWPRAGPLHGGAARRGPRAARRVRARRRGGRRHAAGCRRASGCPGSAT